MSNIHKQNSTSRIATINKFVRSKGKLLQKGRGGISYRGEIPTERQIGIVLMLGKQS